MNDTADPRASRSAALFERAQQVLVGGASRQTLLRSPHPIYVERGRGCRVVDIDGQERIDFANNMCALIHGHAYPPVVEAVTEQVRRGTAFTMGTEAEIRHAELLCSRNPGFDKIRFMNSGTEAVMAALKAARALTGRPRTAKVEGTYHGAYDYAEVSQAPSPESWGDREHPSSVPLAWGTPASILEQVVVLPFNDPKAAVEVLDRHRDDLACVLLDLMPHRVGFVPADPAFVRALRDWTSRNGALLIFDEVITFRDGLGGMQTEYGVTPDLTTMGKIIGGGFPVGALAGREDVMAVFGHTPGAGHRLPHSGTFSGNPVTMTAGWVAMEAYDGAAVAALSALGERAQAAVADAIRVADAPMSVTGRGSLFRVHMKAEPPTDYRSAFPTPAEKDALAEFVTGLYDGGIMPVHTGALVLSTAMGSAEIDRLAEATLSAARRAKRALEG